MRFWLLFLVCIVVATVASGGVAVANVVDAVAGVVDIVAVGVVCRRGRWLRGCPRRC